MGAGAGTNLLPQASGAVLKHWTQQLGGGQAQPQRAAGAAAAAAPPPSSSGSPGTTSAGASNKQPFRIELATARQHRAHAAAISMMVNSAYVRELRDALAGAGGEAAEAAFKRTSTFKRTS